MKFSSVVFAALSHAFVVAVGANSVCTFINATEDDDGYCIVFESRNVSLSFLSSCCTEEATTPKPSIPDLALHSD
jgi:hypothetical protein